MKNICCEKAELLFDELLSVKVNLVKVIEANIWMNTRTLKFTHKLSGESLKRDFIEKFCITGKFSRILPLFQQRKKRKIGLNSPLRSNFSFNYRNFDKFKNEENLKRKDFNTKTDENPKSPGKIEFMMDAHYFRSFKQIKITRKSGTQEYKNSILNIYANV